MAFAGKWESESQEGYDEFCKLLGLSDDYIDKGRDYKVILEVTQDGDNFSWKIFLRTKTMVYNFTVDKECDMETSEGKKFKGTVSMEEGKLSLAFPDYNYTCVISGGKLIETFTAGPVTMTRISKKIKAGN